MSGGGPALRSNVRRAQAGTTESPLVRLAHGIDRAANAMGEQAGAVGVAESRERYPQIGRLLGQARCPGIVAGLARFGGGNPILAHQVAHDRAGPNPCQFVALDC